MNSTKFFKLSSRYKDSEASVPQSVETTFKVVDTVRPLIETPKTAKTTMTLVSAVINVTQVPILHAIDNEYVISPYRANPDGNGFVGSDWLQSGQSYHPGTPEVVRLNKKEYFTIEDVLYDLNTSITEIFNIRFNSSDELQIIMADNTKYANERSVYPPATTIAVSTALKNLLECFPNMFYQNRKETDVLMLPGTTTNAAKNMWILNLAEFRRRSAEGEAGKQHVAEPSGLLYYPTEPIPFDEWGNPAIIPTYVPKLGGPLIYNPPPGQNLGFTGINSLPYSGSNGPLPYCNPALSYKYWTVTSFFPNFNRFFTVRTIEFHAKGLDQQMMYVSNVNSARPVEENIINSVNVDSGFNNSLIHYHPYTDLQTYYLNGANDIYEFEISLHVTFSNGTRIPLRQLSTDESLIFLKMEREA